MRRNFDGNQRRSKLNSAVCTLMIKYENMQGDERKLEAWLLLGRELCLECI